MQSPSPPSRPQAPQASTSRPRQVSSTKSVRSVHSRSPKRAKATPPSMSPTPAPISKYPARPSLKDKRAVTFERPSPPSGLPSPPSAGSSSGASASGSGSAGLGWSLAAGRRRELSVPLLSQTLSSFSLSQSSPPPPPPSRANIAGFRSSPFRMSTATISTSHAGVAALQETPRRASTYTTHILRETPPHPHTAPLPPIATFLGSPFSSRIASGGFCYDAESPIRSRTSTASSGFYRETSEWMEGSEWIVDAALDDLSDHEVTRDAYDVSPSVDVNARRSRRDTDNSTSSMEDYSATASETSSASLHSLHRSSSEHPTRPSLVTIWADEELRAQEGTDVEEDPSTPGRYEELADDVLEISKRSNKSSPVLSPLLRKSSSKKASPLSSFLMSRTPSGKSTRADGTPKRDKSPFAAFLPKLLTTRKSDRDIPPSSPGVPLRHRETSRTLCESPSIPSHPTVIGLGFEMVTSSPGPAGTSPSKPPIPLATLGPPLASPTPLVKPALSRRKTIAAQQHSQKPKSSTKPRPVRPNLRRGVTEPRAAHIINTSLLSVDAWATPPALLTDVRPSPAAFASTGLVKKRSGIAVDIPKFGDTAALRSLQDPAPSSAPPAMSAPAASTAAPLTGLAYAQAVQRTRGLRRKGSQMFASSGSTSSIGEIIPKAISPVTPTKHIAALEVITPSPPPMPRAYPFSSSSTLATSPPTEPLSALNHNTLHRLTRGPIARASNPMLAKAYQAEATKPPKKETKDRLNRELDIVGCLGKGEFSRVWKVKDKQGKLWAVKSGKPYTGNKNRLRQLEEVSILRVLSQTPHRNIIDFVDSWEHRGRLYIRSSLMSCGNLAVFLEALGDHGGLGEIRTWKTLAELSSGLAHIHGHNILHLDIKPSNILITNSGSLRIADFGLSTMSDNDGIASSLSPALPSLENGEFVWKEEGTMPSPIMDREMEGDREYLCPEALSGDVGRAADVFSLGMLILESALNIVLPSNGESWLKLRSDDFGELAEHYVERQVGERGEWREGIPIMSAEMMVAIKGMLAQSAEERSTLEEVREMRMVQKAEEKNWGAALVQETEVFWE